MRKTKAYLYCYGDNLFVIVATLPEDALERMKIHIQNRWKHEELDLDKLFCYAIIEEGGEIYEV